MASLAAVGLFSWVVLVIPAGIGDESTSLTQVALDASRTAGSYPVALALVLAACLAPSFFFPTSAGKYLLRLALVLTFAWLGLFLVTVHPVARAAEKVRETLSIHRTLPDPIPQHERDR
jgi:multidrug efflux pump subunit AcrB